MLTGTWLLTNLQYEPPGDSTDLWALVDKCYKDDLTTYNGNGTGSFDGGADSCLSTQGHGTFTWKWEDDETTIFTVDTDSVTQGRTLHVEISGNTMTSKSDPGHGTVIIGTSTKQ